MWRVAPDESGPREHVEQTWRWRHVQADITDSSSHLFSGYIINIASEDIVMEYSGKFFPTAVLLSVLVTACE